MSDRDSVELAVAGFVRSVVTLSKEMLPDVVLSVIQSWFCVDVVHLLDICREGKGHWKMHAVDLFELNQLTLRGQ